MGGDRDSQIETNKMKFCWVQEIDIKNWVICQQLMEMGRCCWSEVGRKRDVKKIISFGVPICASLLIGVSCERKLENVKRVDEVWYRMWAENEDDLEDDMGNERESELSPELGCLSD